MPFLNLREELRINATEKPAGYQNFINGLEENTIDGSTFQNCAYSKMNFGDYDATTDHALEMRHRMMSMPTRTPLEARVSTYTPGDEENKQDRLELLALAKAVQVEVAAEKEEATSEPA